MPNDYMTLKALAGELDDSLAYGRINKINMPSDNELVMDIWANGKNCSLLWVARKPHARLHLTHIKRIAPAHPSSFCMLLRKHLGGGVIKGIEMYNCDRIIACSIDCKNELHDLVHYKLILEIGGSPNLILTKETPNGLENELTIIDCTNRIFAESGRCLLPNTKYIPPAQIKPNLFCLPQSCLQGITTAKGLTDNFVGIAKETAVEIIALAQSKPLADTQSAIFADTPLAVLKDTHQTVFSDTQLTENTDTHQAVFADTQPVPPAEEQTATLTGIIKELDNLYKSPLYSPCLLNVSGALKGYFAFPYKLGLGEWIKKDSLSGAIDEYFAQNIEDSGKDAATKALRQTLKKLMQKTAKRIDDNAQRLEDAGKKDKFLQLGEIIKGNAYLIKDGQDKVILYDFYNDCDIEIALDTMLSPIKNAAVYFRKYAKLKGAEAYALKEKAELAEQWEYLLTLEAALDNCTQESEFAEVAAELEAIAGSPNAKGKYAKKLKPSQPLKLDIGGFAVYIGKNNVQNDTITFKYASGRDIWMHAKGYHGSHCIIITNGKDVPQQVLAKAAAFTAYYSKAGSATKAEVDYTRRANVKRLGKLGLVNYTDYKTIIATPQKPKNN